MLRLALLLAPMLWIAGCQEPVEKSSVRMVNGQSPTSEDPMQWSAVALVDKRGEAFCSGTLIASQLIVTAAHCVFDKRLEDMQVAFGTDASSSASVRLPLVDKKTFKKYQKFESNFDVAWLRFEGQVPASHKPIEIWHRESELKPGSALTIAGYGATASECDFADPLCQGGRLLKVDTTLRSFVNEGRLYDLLVVEGKANQGSTARSGPCFGDSGGPAYLKREGQWYLVGSFMGWDRILVPEERDTICDQGQGVYTYLGDYAAWIEKSSGIKLPYNREENPRNPSKPFATLEEEPQSFAAWCAYNNHEDPAWYTVQRLIRQASDFRLQREGRDAARAVFEDCAVAETWLRALIASGQTLRILGYDPDNFIDSARIEDVRPLASLASMNPKGLILSDHSIRDLTPLTQLRSLELLEITDNTADESGGFQDQSFFQIQSLPELKVLKILNSTAPINLEGLGQLQELRELALSYISVEQELNLRNPQLESLRIDSIETNRSLRFDRLDQLKILALRKISVGELPESLPLLESLDLLETSNLLRLPSDLPSLKTFTLYGTDFSGVLSLQTWKNLNKVSIIANPSLRALGPVVDLPLLKELEVVDNNLELFAEIADLPRLEELSLVRNRLKVLPTLVALPLLRRLDLEGNSFTQLPSFKELKSIEWLSLNNNPLKNLEGVAGLKNLKRLTVRNKPGQGLKDLDGLYDLPALDDLNLGRNALSSVEGLRGLTQLRVLVLSDNKIEDLTDLKALEQLEYLEAVNNPLRSRDCPVARPNTCRFEWILISGTGLFPRPSELPQRAIPFNKVP